MRSTGNCSLGTSSRGDLQSRWEITELGVTSYITLEFCFISGTYGLGHSGLDKERITNSDHSHLSEADILGGAPG